MSGTMTSLHAPSLSWRQKGSILQLALKPYRFAVRMISNAVHSCCLLWEGDRLLVDFGAIQHITSDTTKPRVPAHEPRLAHTCKSLGLTMRRQGWKQTRLVCEVVNRAIKHSYCSIWLTWPLKQYSKIVWQNLFITMLVAPWSQICTLVPDQTFQQYKLLQSYCMGFQS